MKLEVNPSSSSYTDDDQKNLNYLLETFGAVVSLEDMASAYCQGGRNLDITCEILCSKQCNTSGSSSLESQDYIDRSLCASIGCTSDLSQNPNVSTLKPKKSSASMGTVSGVIGREYAVPRPQTTELRENRKPVKLHSGNFLVSEIRNEKESKQPASSGDFMNHDIEEFLYKMLGNGFQLDMSVIHDVVGQCGYNMQMSFDKLLDLSAETLEKSDDVISAAATNTMEINREQKSKSCNRKSPLNDECGSTSSQDEIGLPQGKKKNIDDQREILESLFSVGVPDTIDDKHEATNPVRRETRRLSHWAVTKPLEDVAVEDFTFITRQTIGRKNDEGKENDYEDLRKAVTEHWRTMKEYYKAAIDAHTKSDFVKAQKFLEQGNFFMKKAREADEKSTQKLIGSSYEQEQLSLNMHYLDPKEALKHLRFQLTSVSGISTIPYLKIVVGTDGKDTKEGRRKRLITKLLEKEGIPWSEEGNGWTISVRVDCIDPKKLSFANK